MPGCEPRRRYDLFLLHSPRAASIDRLPPHTCAAVPCALTARARPASSRSPLAASAAVSSLARSFHSRERS
eukprot:3452694-Prymnesium_polylepis.3